VNIISAVLQIAIILFLMSVIIVTRRMVSVPWLSLGFFVVTLVILVFRLDDIGHSLRIHLLSSRASEALSWLLIGAIAAGKLAVYRRAKLLRDFEAKYQAEVDQLKEAQEKNRQEKRKMGLERAAQLERLRAYDEQTLVGYSWSFIPDFQRVEYRKPIYQAESKNGS
jgi:predicted ferric reductase